MGFRFASPSLKILVALAVLAPKVAVAQALKVAVLPITGSEGAVEARIERALREGNELVRPSDWDAAAKRLLATSKKAGDIATVAKDLGVQVVVTGAIKQDAAGWSLAISVRHGPTGKKAERLSYSLASGEVDEATQQRLAREIGPSVRRAASGPATGDAGDDDKPRAETTPAAPQAKPAFVPSSDHTAGAPAPVVPASATTEPREEGAVIERPVWTPWFDASAGLIVSGRNLVLVPRTQPFFASTVAAGLHADATIYPLALSSLATRPGAAINAITGLGLGATVDGIFWPDAVPCMPDPVGKCMAGAPHFGVRELRFEAGLRWHWTPLRRPDSVELLASLQYGQHALTIDKRPDGSDLGPPDTSYSYITAGIGGRVPLSHWFAVVVRFNYHALLGQGPVTALTEYGSGGGNGLRFGGGVELTLWKGLVARVEGFYERFALSFDGSGMPEKTGTSGVDQYYGGILSLGWVEHRSTVQTVARAPVADADGDGVPDADDKCPTLAGTAAASGCPDADGDDVLDNVDRCPTKPGPAALKGCPDSDGDGVADIDDDCASVAGEAKNRGCPTYKAITVTAERIELSEKIFFAYDKVEILPKSLGILDEVVQALIDHPSLRVKILGHTDSMGNEKHNLELSGGRANAVVQYLVGHGVEAARLESTGFGSQYPVDSNKTQAGRENNRRVEFLLVKEPGAESPASPESPGSPGSTGEGTAKPDQGQ